MKKRSAIIIAIILMSIGFAAVSTTLVINGNTKVSENEEDFSVIFTAASLDGKDVSSSVIDDTKKIITFETSELKTLNQTSVLTYEITNNSSNYDAEVSITCTPTTSKYTSIKNELESNTTKVLAKNSVSGTLKITLDKLPTEELTEEYTCKLEFNAVERDNVGVTLTQFEKDSWSTIAEKVKSGNTSKYHVGDTKAVNLGTFGTHTVRIANMSECTSGETSETACGFVVEFADIITRQKFNSSNTNVGGWKDSEIRTYINGTIFNELPSDLQNVIITTKVISGHGPTSGETNFETRDNLYLLSSEEIYEDFTSSGNAQYDSATGTSRQLDYYQEAKISTSDYLNAIKKFNGVADYWWLRSIDSHVSGYALGIGGGGNWYGNSMYDYYSVSPAFRIA